ncbi:type II toxin-antitoxin system VapB family antitoxin [Streptomyces cyaneofuscatus]|uniref:type II toxin-antitoxin system VapB family antitoxin n=1 Tax=Streptomyces cyaneofuscatus TaxID=66883 RepID=UPI0036B24CFC
MISTVIDLSNEALEAAADEPGAMPRRTTINTALRESVDRYRRLCALHELQHLASEGALDMNLLLDAPLPTRRWRRPATGGAAGRGTTTAGF